MLISIVVLSYNRPVQIERILKNIVSAMPGDFNLIVKDDCSPKQCEIEKIVESYVGRAGFPIIFHKNKINLGYDGNLLDAFSITDSDYVFLLSDDDYIDGNHVPELINLLAMKRYKLYFSPYASKGLTFRCNTGSFKLGRFHEVIYNSILFSGLIFHRETVLSLPKDKLFLSKCIYSQVYLASVIAFHEKNYGEAPKKLLHLGGDGENFFGKNQSAINRETLQDRESIVSNIKYQKLLLAVVDKVAEATHPCVKNVFLKEYNRRLASYLLRARSSGLSGFNLLVAYIKTSRMRVAWYVVLTMRFLPVIPPFLAGAINKSATRIFRKAG